MGWVRASEESTIKKIFNKVDIQELDNAFRKYVQDVSKLDKASTSKVIAIDSKTLRGSFDHLKEQKAYQVKNP